MAIAEPLGLTEEDRLLLRNATIAALALPDFEVVKDWDGWPLGTTCVDFDARLEQLRPSRQGRPD